MQAYLLLAGKNRGGYKYVFTVQRVVIRLPEKYITGSEGSIELNINSILCFGKNSQSPRGSTATLTML